MHHEKNDDEQRSILGQNVPRARRRRSRQRPFCQSLATIIGRCCRLGRICCCSCRSRLPHLRRRSHQRTAAVRGTQRGQSGWPERARRRARREGRLMLLPTFADDDSRRKKMEILKSSLFRSSSKGSSFSYRFRFTPKNESRCRRLAARSCSSPLQRRPRRRGVVVELDGARAAKKSAGSGAQAGPGAPNHRARPGFSSNNNARAERSHVFLPLVVSRLGAASSAAAEERAR